MPGGGSRYPVASLRPASTTAHVGAFEKYDLTHSPHWQEQDLPRCIISNFTFIHGMIEDE